MCDEEGRLSGFLNHPRFDGLDRDQHTLGSAAWEFDADALKIGAKLALCDARHVSADASALLGLTLAVDSVALDWAFTGDCTNSGHDGFRLVKGGR